MLNLGILVILAWLGLQNPGADSIKGTPERGDSLVVGNPSGPDFLNPAISQTADPTGYLMSRLFPALADNDFDCKLRYVPALAESWEWSPDRKCLKVNLRKDMVWDDGHPVSIDDVLFTFDLIRDSRVASPRSTQVASLNPKKPIEKISDSVLLFHFEAPADTEAQFSQVAQILLLPKHKLEKADRSNFRADPFHLNPTTAGAFRFERWREGQDLVLVRNDKAVWSHPSYLNRIVFRIISDYNTCLRELEAGGIDLMYSILPKDLERLAKNPDLRILNRGERFLDYVSWNCQNELFADPEIRKALALAVDCEKLIDAFFSAGGKRYAKRAVWSISPVVCEAADSTAMPLPFDPKRATSILEARGWAWNDKRTFLQKEGKPLKFSLLTFAAAPRLMTTAQVLQQMWAKVGVQVDIDAKEFNLANELLRSRKFDAALLGWQAELWVSPSTLLGTGQPFNFGGYSNPRVDSLINQSAKETNLEKRKAIWHDLIQLVIEDQPSLFLYWRDVPMAIHKRFQGVHASVLDPLHDVENWWVPKSEQKYSQ